jgi:hypothetical protein
MRVLGTTDERTECDCCGRTGLKSTVALENEGEIVYFGVVCAAKATGRAAKVIRSEASAADEAKRRAEREAREAADRLERNRWFAWLLARTGLRDWQGRVDVLRALQALGGHDVAHRLYLAEVGA